MATKITKRVLTPPFRGSFLHLITPKPYLENGQPKGDPRFQMDMIFDPISLTKFRAEDGSGNLVELDIKKLAVQTVREQWPELADNEKFKGAFLKGDGTPGKGWPFKDGDSYIAEQNAKRKSKNKGDLDMSAFAGKVVISAKSYENVKPLLSYFDKELNGGKGGWRLLQRSSDVDMKKAADLFTGGHYFGAELSMRPSEVSGTKYVSFYINAVRFLKEGETFGNKGMMERFDGVYGGESDHNPMKGMDDEIPF